MFASDMNPVRDAVRVTTAGMVLFPIQFTWPHGGRSVFLSGSFNRWTELVPMLQVEGCPNVFQAVRAVPHGCHEAGPCDNLKDVALKILQNGVAIIPVIRSSSEDGSFPQLLHLTSLSGILKCICRYFKHCSGSLPILQLPIYAIPLGTWVPRIGESSSRPFAMLRPSASLSSALNMLVQAQVSSIPIVDDNDSLLDIYCRSNIAALAKGRVYTQSK